MILCVAWAIVDEGDGGRGCAELVCVNGVVLWNPAHHRFALQIWGMVCVCGMEGEAVPSRG